MLRSAGIATMIAVSALSALAGASHAQDAAGESYPTIEQFEGWNRWDGTHVGGFIAYARGGAYDSLGPLAGVDSFEGWMSGLTAGVDVTLSDGSVVAGFAADLGWGKMPVVDDSLSHDVGNVVWTGSLRGRIGLGTESFLPYVTAGVAAAGAKFASSDGLETVGGTHLGWTAGVGVEVAISDQFTLDLLYRYSDYGAVEYAYTSPSATTVERGFTTHQLSAGVNYRF
jgi:outer membrane immunogenic protein